MNDESEKELMHRQCLKEKLTPHELAQAVLFFSSEQASGCTNQSYVVDKGLYQQRKIDLCIQMLVLMKKTILLEQVHEASIFLSNTVYALIPFQTRHSTINLFVFESLPIQAQLN